MERIRTILFWFCVCGNFSVCHFISGEALANKLTEFVNTEIVVDDYQVYLDTEVRYDRTPLNQETTKQHLLEALGKKFSDRVEALTKLRDALSVTSPNSSPECCTLSLNERDDRFQKEVDLTKVCEIGEKRNEAVKHTPDSVVEVMKQNLQTWPSLKWQYYGTEEGLLSVYPAHKLCDETYDPRFRPYYVETATPKPKDVVLVIDVSGSMRNIISQSNKRLLDVAISAAQSVIDTLNPNDRVGIVEFSDEAKTPPGTVITSCYSTNLAKATPENRAYLRRYVSGLSTIGGTYYIKAINKAFDLFKNTEEDTYDKSGRDKVILFLSDGKPQDTGKIAEAITNRNEEMNNEVVMLTYGIGGAKDPAAEGILMEMASNAPIEGDVNSGYTRVDNDLDLRRTMSSYYSRFALTGSDDPVTFTVPYIDKFGLGLVTSACLPVIQASSDGNLAGVACVDITLSDLFSDVTYFKQGELSYAFVVDGQSRLLSHPMMPRPYGLQDETVFIHMPSLEADSDDVRLSMISGQSGEEILQSRRSFSRGVRNEDGVISRKFESTYMWGPIANSNFSLCLVVATGDLPNEVVSDVFDDNFRYHSLILSDNEEGVCRYYNRLASKDISTVKFAASAFQSPFSYLDREETKNIVERYETHMKGGPANNNDFKSGIRDTVSITANFDDMLKPSEFSIWRYLATENGVFRVLPGIGLPKEYDATIRPWYLRAVGNKGLLTVSTPYEDKFGAGMVITLSKALYHGKSGGVHNPDDPAFGVLSVDMSLAGFLYQFLDAYPECDDTENTCFIIDNSGFIVAHDDFKGQSSTEHKDQLENIHIIKKEPSISAHMINEGSLQARSCVDHQKHRTQKTWEVEQSGDVTEGDGYTMYAVSGVDIFIIIKKKNRAEGQRYCDKCESAKGDTKCSIACECPCYSSTEDLYSYCAATVSSNDDTIPPCTPTLLEPDLKTISTKEVERVEDFDFCFSLDCQSKIESSNCSIIAGCEWCPESETCINREKDTCDGGSSGSSGGSSGSSGLSTGALAGIAIGAIVVLVVVAVIVFCVLKNRTSSDTRPPTRDFGHHNVAMTPTAPPSQPNVNYGPPVTPTGPAAPPSYGDVVMADHGRI